MKAGNRSRGAGRAGGPALFVVLGIALASGSAFAETFSVPVRFKFFACQGDQAAAPCALAEEIHASREIELVKTLSRPGFARHQGRWEKELRVGPSVFTAEVLVTKTEFNGGRRAPQYWVRSVLWDHAAGRESGTVLDQIAVSPERFTLTTVKGPRSRHLVTRLFIGEAPRRVE